MANFTGTAGNDKFVGGADDDIFNMSQGGIDRVNGGGGDDLFDFGGAFTAQDQVVGGAGDDELNLTGDYSAGLTLTTSSVRQIETLSFGAGFDYRVTMADGNLASRQVMNVSAYGLTASDHFFFDGSAESNGSFHFSARFCSATLIGGGGADSFRIGDSFSSGLQGGGGGGDGLTGGRGADTFTFLSLGRAAARPHEITDLTNADKIDISQIDADTHTIGDQAFVLVRAFTHHAGEARLHFDAAANETSLALDTNGDGRADSTILLDGNHHTFTNFVL
jgi:Ca2+-binding RTX toxin-like protein